MTHLNISDILNDVIENGNVSHMLDMSVNFLEIDWKLQIVDALKKICHFMQDKESI